jgi:hypothetical protein
MRLVIIIVAIIRMGFKLLSKISKKKNDFLFSTVDLSKSIDVRLEACKSFEINGKCEKKNNKESQKEICVFNSYFFPNKICFVFAHY